MLDDCAAGGTPRSRQFVIPRVWVVCSRAQADSRSKMLFGDERGKIGDHTPSVFQNACGNQTNHHAHLGTKQHCPSTSGQQTETLTKLHKDPDTHTNCFLLAAHPPMKPVIWRASASAKTAACKCGFARQPAAADTQQICQLFCTRARLAVACHDPAAKKLPDGGHHIVSR